MHSILLLQAHPLHESSAHSRKPHTHTHTHVRQTTLDHVFKLDREHPSDTEQTAASSTEEGDGRVYLYTRALTPT